MGCLQEKCHHTDFAKIAEHCEQHGVKLTPLREKVLRAICDAEKPLTAYVLLDVLSEEEGSKIQAMSVYRILNYLLENGLIHRIESLNAFVLCHHLTDCDHFSQWLICNECGEVTECDLPTFQPFLKDVAETTAFQVRTPVVELSGICEHCQKV